MEQWPPVFNTCKRGIIRKITYIHPGGAAMRLRETLSQPLTDLIRIMPAEGSGEKAEEDPFFTRFIS